MRIYFDRPWYQSGVGELLGIILPTAQMGVVLDDIDFSRWGRDPLSTLPGPSKNLSPKDLRSPGSVTLDVMLPQSKKPAIVVGFPVEFNTERNLWYADIAIDAYGFDHPFVRLALVRFQPHSIKDRYVSEPVLADFAQLTPDRTASLTIDTTLPTRVFQARLDGPALAPQSRVELSIERGRALDDDIRWEPADSSPPIVMGQRDDGDGPYMLTDQIPIPFGTGPLRAVIREYVVLDEDGPGDDAAHPGKANRVIFAAALEL
jgi:hypothetical protein